MPCRSIIASRRSSSAHLHGPRHSTPAPGLRHLYRVGQQQPFDDLGARRRRQRTGVAIITELGRKHRIGIASLCCEAFYGLAQTILAPRDSRGPSVRGRRERDRARAASTLPATSARASSNSSDPNNLPAALPASCSATSSPMAGDGGAEGRALTPDRTSDAITGILSRPAGRHVRRPAWRARGAW